IGEAQGSLRSRDGRPLPPLWTSCPTPTREPSPSSSYAEPVAMPELNSQRAGAYGTGIQGCPQFGVPPHVDPTTRGGRSTSSPTEFHADRTALTSLDPGPYSSRAF